MTTSSPIQHPWRLLAALLYSVVMLLWSPALMAQQPDDSAGKMMQIKVKVTFDQSKADISKENIPVFLRAARVKGPFEPKDPDPVKEWSALTDASGQAVFSKVPAALATQGLRLQAVASWDDSIFKTNQYAPANGLEIEVPIYERGSDLSTLRVQSLRMIIEPWEGYLVYTQVWELAVDGEQALDTTLIPDPDFKDGIPIELPLKASGINYNGAEGQHKIVNSTVYWQGVIKPGQPVSFQLRYSMPVKDAEYVYEQPLTYPTKKFELIIPLETNYKNKLPRLNGLGLLAPGFKPEDIQSGFNIPGLRPDREFIYAVRRDIPQTEGIKFKLTNLPYARPTGPWVALMIGLFGMLVVAFFALREKRALEEGSRHASTITALEEELGELFKEIELLQKDLDAGDIAESEFEQESILLQTRVGLILKKLDELRGESTLAGAS